MRRLSPSHVWRRTSRWHIVSPSWCVQQDTFGTRKLVLYATRCLFLAPCSSFFGCPRSGKHAHNIAAAVNQSQMRGISFSARARARQCFSHEKDIWGETNRTAAKSAKLPLLTDDDQRKRLARSNSVLANGTQFWNKQGPGLLLSSRCRPVKEKWGSVGTAPFRAKKLITALYLGEITTEHGRSRYVAFRHRTRSTAVGCSRAHPSQLLSVLVPMTVVLRGFLLILRGILC